MTVTMCGSKFTSVRLEGEYDESGPTIVHRKCF